MDHTSGQGTGSTQRDDERGLIISLQHGDEAAFRLIVERYHPMLLRLAQMYVHDRSIAEEVTQDAWLGMLTGLGRFAGHSSLRTWLFGILINCARASWRRESRSIPFSTFAPPDIEQPASVPSERFHPPEHAWAGHWATPPEEWPEEHLLAIETRQQLEEAVQHLPPHQRIVITLRDIEGWTSAEVCEALHLSASNQRVLLHRARSRLREEIDSVIHATGEGDKDHGQH